MIQPTLLPQYMTESSYVINGFFTGTANSTQINMAFALAEWQVQRELGTYLSPTQFTGSYTWPKENWILQSPVTRIISVDSVVLHQAYTNGVDRLISGTADIIDYENGYFRVKPSPYDVSSCSDCGYIVPEDVYRADVTITAGFATGTHLQPNIQLALGLAADINLNQFMDRGMGQEYENFVSTFQAGRTIQTHLNRFAMNTPFGASNRAQYIRELLRGLKVERAGKLGAG